MSRPFSAPRGVVDLFSGAVDEIHHVLMVFEASMLVFSDFVSILLRERTGQTSESMRSRHTNLE